MSQADRDALQRLYAFVFPFNSTFNSSNASMMSSRFSEGLYDALGPAGLPSYDG